MSAEKIRGKERKRLLQPVKVLSGKLTDYSTEKLHRHNVHQVLLIRDGVSLLVEEGRRQPLYGNMCAFLPAGCLHRTVVIGESVTYQSLYISEDMIKIPGTGIVIFSLSELGIALFNRIASEKKRDSGSGILKDIIELFIRILGEDIASGRYDYVLPEPHSEECRKLTEYIEENYMRKISMADFRSVLPYSERHIARLFSVEMKITLFEYLRMYRMFMATVMLHGERSVLELSLDCGYESLSSFYNDFSRYFSLTPGEFRKSVSGNQGN